MRSMFPGWFPKSPDQINAIWEKALFVPDTNILLHCVRVNQEVRASILSYLDKMRDSIWIPYQVALEFHRSRKSVEAGTLSAYDKLAGECASQLNVLTNSLEGLKKNHPIIDVAAELDHIGQFRVAFKERMSAAKARHPAAEISAAVDALIHLFEGHVGERWSEADLDLLAVEGERRYANKVPPGYTDKRKQAGEGDKFGDLLLWKALMRKAKADKRPVILITDDAKEDWWVPGQKTPRPEIIDEFWREAGQEFHMLDLTQFSRHASKVYTDVPDRTEAVEASVREAAEQRERDDSSREFLRQALLRLEIQRDGLAAMLAGVGPAGLEDEKGRNRTELLETIRRLDEEIERKKMESASD